MMVGLALRGNANGRSDFFYRLPAGRVRAVVTFLLSFVSF